MSSPKRKKTLSSLLSSPKRRSSSASVSSAGSSVSAVRGQARSTSEDWKGPIDAYTFKQEQHSRRKSDEDDTSSVYSQQGGALESIKVKKYWDVYAAPPKDSNKGKLPFLKDIGRQRRISLEDHIFITDNKEKPKRHKRFLRISKEIEFKKDQYKTKYLIKSASFEIIKIKPEKKKVYYKTYEGGEDDEGEFIFDNYTVEDIYEFQALLKQSVLKDSVVKREFKALSSFLSEASENTNDSEIVSSADTEKTTNANLSKEKLSMAQLLLERKKSLAAEKKVAGYKPMSQTALKNVTGTMSKQAAVKKSTANKGPVQTVVTKQSGTKPLQTSASNEIDDNTSVRSSLTMDTAINNSARSLMGGTTNDSDTNDSDTTEISMNIADSSSPDRPLTFAEVYSDVSVKTSEQEEWMAHMKEPGWSMGKKKTPKPWTIKEDGSFHASGSRYQGLDRSKTEKEKQQTKKRNSVKISGSPKNPPSRYRRISLETIVSESRLSGTSTSSETDVETGDQQQPVSNSPPSLRSFRSPRSSGNQQQPNPSPRNNNHLNCCQKLFHGTYMIIATALHTIGLLVGVSIFSYGILLVIRDVEPMVGAGIILATWSSLIVISHLSGLLGSYDKCSCGNFWLKVSIAFAHLGLLSIAFFVVVFYFQEGNLMEYMKKNHDKFFMSESTVNFIIEHLLWIHIGVGVATVCELTR